MSAGGGDDKAFEKLRDLFVGEATRRLDAVESRVAEIPDLSARVEKIDAFVGESKRLEAATADILVEALRTAEVKRHREFANALAPLVVAAIRAEIKNSKEMMVEALYPITGRLVTAAVAGAFRDLVENLNRRIDALVSAHSWRLRFRALATGRSMAEVAMAEADAGVLKRALLLERGSGRVLATWPEAAEEADHDDLASGLIAAITEFAATVYADRGGELRMLDMGASHVFLRASTRVIVAAEFAGELSGGRERRLDDAFLSIVEAHERDESGFAAKAMGEPLEEALRDEPPPPTSKAPAIVVGALAAGATIWFSIDPAVRAWRERKIHAAFDAAMAARGALADYPLRLEIDHANARVILRGLTADESEPQAVVDAIAPAAIPYAAVRDVKVVVLAPQAADLQADGAKAGAQLAELQAKVAQAKAAIDQWRSETDAPAARLTRFIETFAVFFTEQDALVDPEAAGKGLDELAALLLTTGENLRVVGYADENGSITANRAASRKRADKIVAMLTARGVPREQLALAPRAAATPIADSGLDAARSRRVVFERPYAREFEVR
jgi:outer membrane protein OmpA-like peptidoglycan-associated protein